MRKWKQSAYGLVPVEEQQSDSSPAGDFPLHLYHRTVKQPVTSLERPTKPPPQPLEASWLVKGLRLAFDLTVGSVALLFAIFGIWVYQIDGSPAGPGSTGSKLFKVSQYAPTIFPVLFAAIAGSFMSSIAAWRIQTSRGASIGLVEHCLGSQTLSGAFLTPIRLRAFSLFTVATIFLWILSPLGSQAALRVVSIVTSDSSSPKHLATMNTFTEYQYGYAEGVSEALTTVANPVIAAISAASLLGTRNQDLWGNIRFPMIQNLNNTSDGWTDVPQNNNLTYASLIGTPVSVLPSSGQTAFTLPGSYLSISCPILGISSQTGFTNYSSPGTPAPDNWNDCTWSSSTGGSQYQIAISKPCSGYNVSMDQGDRNARLLVWESSGSYAKCSLTTLYVDINVTCTESVSGSSSTSTCNIFSARRSLTPQFKINWTVLDIGTGSVDAGSVLKILTGLFPDAQLSGGQQPVLVYFTNPYHAVGDFDTPEPIYNVGRKVFETRLAQLLNSVLYMGISPSAFTGSFNSSGILPGGSVLKIAATTTLQQEVVQCNLAWLGVLVVASLTIFVCALIGAFLRITRFSPDVLGSISVALLHNKIRGIAGSSTWSSDEWARKLRDTKLYLGDIEPGAEVGCIALATSVQDATNLKRVTLELGGKSPAVVFDDCNLDNAVEWCVNAIARNTGQVCFAASRVYVQEGIIDQFTQKYKAALEERAKTIGGPDSDETQIGPLVDEAQFQRVTGFIERGAQQGTLLTGGKRVGDKGFFVQPTVFTGVESDAEIYHQEIFGPVSILNSFKTEEEVLRKANATEYGLMAGVFTQDINKAMRVASEFESGMVGINCVSVNFLNAPFGGRKQSGLGRECGRSALEHFTEPKTIMSNLTY
ncbi:hypothetical protein N7520_003458 [Penicillium odoratum]|uniref:uncharacterized protein n=1 Tax=Penicillium odoratum TaxID=1167516 RepID=UPI002548B8F6|nr:uncharacterized protein N7520_003458 [Penicillium odoratum]KAJ5768899.1 hypothetical protein N7520_003458 [Penicillium odoratum]